MRVKVLVALAVVGLVVATSGPAEAKRRGLGVPVDGRKVVRFVSIGASGLFTGTMPTPVLAYELPDAPPFIAHDGRHFDLGYRHGRLWGGEWIGYRADKQHLALDQEGLPAFMANFGVDLSRTPPREENEQIRWTFRWSMIAIAGVLLWMVANLLLNRPNAVASPQSRATRRG